MSCPNVGELLCINFLLVKLMEPSEWLAGIMLKHHFELYHLSFQLHVLRLGENVADRVPQIEEHSSGNFLAFTFIHKALTDSSQNLSTKYF